jgi:hypothetical protein
LHPLLQSVTPTVFFLIFFYYYFIPTCFGPYRPSSGAIYTSEFLRAIYAATDPLCFLSQSQSHITTDNESVSQPWCQAPIWDPRPYCLRCCSVLSDERTGLSFTVADGPRQRSHLMRGQVCLLAVFR